MSEPREPLRRIVVAGSGQVALLSAIALRRALPTTEVVLLAVAPQGPAFADFAEIVEIPTLLPVRQSRGTLMMGRHLGSGPHWRNCQASSHRQRFEAP